MTSKNWDSVISLLQERQFADAIACLDTELRNEPTNVDAFLLRSIAKSQIGLTQDAETDLWRALVVDPSAKGARSALADLFLKDMTAADEAHDFALDSGERQTEADIEAIRRDHSSRYEFAAHWLNGHLDPAHDATGLDLFCGNGYGSRILADLSGARIVGVDGSAAAVAMAETTYGDHRVVFRQALFPFVLTPRAVDFAVCFESVEHVEDCDELLRQVGAATSGPIFLSFPLESGLPFAINKDLFRFHVRHFTMDEMADKLLRLTGRRIVKACGQTVYRLSDRRLADLPNPSRKELSPLNDASQFAVVVAV
jgi:SAM-dependent methyltransferase